MINKTWRKRKVVLKYFWLIVRDKRNGNVLNADVIGSAIEPKDKIVERFEKKYPFYMVLDMGEGLDNRPTFVENLPFIEKN